MKNRKSRKLSYTLIIAMLFTTLTLSAQQMRRGGGQHHPAQMEQNERGQRGMHQKGPRGPHIPNLTAEQKEQLKEFRVEMSKEALPLENQINEQEAKLRTLTTSETYDAKAVENLIEEIGEVKTELEKLKVGQLQKIKSILTDEQIVAFNKQISQRPKKGHHRG